MIKCDVNETFLFEFIELEGRKSGIWGTSLLAHDILVVMDSIGQSIDLKLVLDCLEQRDV